MTPEGRPSSSRSIGPANTPLRSAVTMSFAFPPRSTLIALASSFKSKSPAASARSTLSRYANCGPPREGRRSSTRMRYVPSAGTFQVRCESVSPGDMSSQVASRLPVASRIVRTESTAIPNGQPGGRAGTCCPLRAVTCQSRPRPGRRMRPLSTAGSVARCAPPAAGRAVSSTYSGRSFSLEPQFTPGVASNLRMQHERGRVAIGQSDVQHVGRQVRSKNVQVDRRVPAAAERIGAVNHRTASEGESIHEILVAPELGITNSQLVPAVERRLEAAGPRRDRASTRFRRSAGRRVRELPNERREASRCGPRTPHSSPRLRRLPRTSISPHPRAEKSVH